MNDDEIIAVVQAHKEGQPIQSKHRNDSIWLNNPADFQWNFGIYDYRAVPFPSILQSAEDQGRNGDEQQ